MDDPFRLRFAWFVDHWSPMEGFSCVVAYDKDEPAAFAYGAPLAPGREWWRSTGYEPSSGYTSTYAVSEVMMRPKWREQGISERLHEALLKERTEDLAGEQQPFADSPVYAVMVKTLRA